MNHYIILLFLQKFLLLDEIKEDPTSNRAYEDLVEDSNLNEMKVEANVKIQDVKAKWESDDVSIYSKT